MHPFGINIEIDVFSVTFIKTTNSGKYIFSYSLTLTTILN